MLNYGINAWNKTWSHPLLSNQQVSNSARCLKAVHCLTFNLSWCWHIPKEVDRLLIVIRAKEFSSRGKCGQSRWSLACCSYHRFTHGKLKYSTLTALSLFLLCFGIDGPQFHRLFSYTLAFFFALQSLTIQITDNQYHSMNILTEHNFRLSFSSTFIILSFVFCILQSLIIQINVINTIQCFDWT